MKFIVKSVNSDFWKSANWPLLQATIASSSRLQKWVKKSCGIFQPWVSVNVLAEHGSFALWAFGYRIYFHDIDSSYSRGVVFTMSFTLTHSFSRQLVPRLPCCCSDSCRWCCYGDAVARRQTFPRMWRQSSRSDCTTSSRSRGERRTSSSRPWAWLWLWAWWSWAPAALL